MIASYRHDLFVAFDSPVLGVLVEALRLADSRRDRVVLEQVCRQWRSMTGEAIEPRAVEAAASAGGDLLRAWADAAEEAGQGRAALRRIRADLVDGMDFPGIVDSFLDGGWRSWAKGDLADVAGEEVEIWRILHREIARSDPGATPSTYMRRLDLASKAPPPAPDALRCMTVHRSKGLQFGHVYLVGMAQDVFPSYRTLRQGSGEVEEERRSCFVAIARARETLTLTRARRYRGRYRKRASQFLSETGLRRERMAM